MQASKQASKKMLTEKGRSHLFCFWTLAAGVIEIFFTSRIEPVQTIWVWCFSSSFYICCIGFIYSIIWYGSSHLILWWCPSMISILCSIFAGFSSSGAIVFFFLLSFYFCFFLLLLLKSAKNLSWVLNSVLLWLWFIFVQWLWTSSRFLLLLLLSFHMQIYPVC